MNKGCSFLFYFCCSTLFCNAQFAPQAGLTASTAIHKDSNLIAGWATQCNIIRGWQNIADTTLGKTWQGDSSRANGYADGDIVSLGDGGEAIYFFDNPVANGPGADFAIFENGFLNPLDSNFAYLELATVAVSNDGVTYYQFAALSHTDTVNQIAGTGEYMDCRKINNLAGKYILNYGTPFELDELSGQVGLDVNDIKYIKVKDVTGSLMKEYCTIDNNNMKINDPYPTPFPTGGFDLDALAVLHYKYPLGIDVVHKTALCVYPNPCADQLFFKSKYKLRSAAIFSYDGKKVLPEILLQQNKYLDIHDLGAGLYLLKLVSEDGRVTMQRFVKQ